jgi:predicted nucleic acid-binding protein
LILLDTSAIYALADRNDRYHAEAGRILAGLTAAGEEFVLHSYVMGESAALLQSRLGRRAALAFLAEAGAHHLEWIGPDLHGEAVAMLGRLKGEGIGLADCASFVVMRYRGIREAFSFAPHFADQGFRLAAGR